MLSRASLYSVFLLLSWLASPDVIALSNTETKPSILTAEIKVPDSVVITTYSDSKKQKVIRQSLGTVFEADGFILSSYKSLLAPGTKQLVDNLSVDVNGKRFDGNIVGVEPTINLAIVKIFADQALKPSVLKDGEELELGQALYAASRESDGSISSKIGRLTALNSRECYQESLTSTMYKVELELTESNLGGAIYTAQGDVVAFYTGYEPTIESHENDDQFHVLPAKLALNIYESLKHKKSMKSPWTGFSVIPIGAKERRWFPTEHGDRGGIAIEYVWPESPAAKLGIQPGDVLVRFGHYRILSPADFQKWLYMYGVGHKVRLVLLRDGQYYMKDYVIEERPSWALPK